ncbi:CLUMA_CG004728, isoform A [Clunio marinus]|uniref:CLUMA_CG004728, isoform A n=1 Tax=Clunio marinus TaxID=568069 RepID=A0A1J1HSI7_9DIPT|nr:CLUMA_CG004728, isoform A [Clunio marinus]
MHSYKLELGKNQQTQKRGKADCLSDFDTGKLRFSNVTLQQILSKTLNEAHGTNSPEQHVMQEKSIKQSKHKF